MNEIFTLNNLTEIPYLGAISTPKVSGYSSDSLVDESDEITQQLISERIDTVRSNIGKDLFNRLSYDDQMLMVNTAGVIDFGRPIDLGEVEKEIRNYGYSK